MSEKCTVFAGGEPVSADALDMSFISNSTVYGADKGYYLAKSLGIDCDIVIGDFDSSPRPECGDVLVFPKEKDDTDLMLAIKHALKNGAKDIRIYGALGGSADHLYGNIQSLAYIVTNGGSALITGDSDIIRLLPAGRYVISDKKGWSLSLFSYSERVEGLTIKGTKYTAQDITLDNSFPLAVSNCITAPKGAELSFSAGLLLVIQSKR